MRVDYEFFNKRLFCWWSKLIETEQKADSTYEGIPCSAFSDILEECYLGASLVEWKKACELSVQED